MIRSGQHEVTYRQTAEKKPMKEMEYLKLQNGQMHLKMKMIN